MDGWDAHSREHDRLERDGERAYKSHVREHAAHDAIHQAERNEVEKAERRLDASHAALEQRMDMVERAQTAALGRSYGLTATGKLILGLAVVVASVASIISWVIVITH